MPKYENIIVTRDKKLPGLMTITLDRPEKLNALNVALHDDLQDALHRLQSDYETRVVILTGAGRAFSAGAQIGDRRESTPANDIDRRARASIGGKTSDMLERLEQVTIGAVNGLAVGGAVVFLSCLDMRIASEDAWFSIPEVDLDLPLTWQALPRLMRELGPARTKELVMACERSTAQQAERWGFVNHVYPADQVMPESRKLAARLLSMDPLSLASTKSACSALANMMVPVEVTWSDREMMLLAYRQGALRAQGNGKRAARPREGSSGKRAAKKT